MTFDNFKEFFKNNDNVTSGLEIDVLEKLYKYMCFCLEYNQKTNLTSITDEKEFIVKHFLDSLTLLPFLTTDKPSSFIDVGTGAGFPGVPLLICNSKLNGVLLDSNGKKIRFLEELIGVLNINPIILNSRSESAAQSRNHREVYDVCVSRAVAHLRILSELCLGFVKPDGIFLAQKSKQASDELKEARPAIKAMGGVVEDVIEKELTFGLSRSIIVIRKSLKTPDAYPRAFSKISNNPIF